MIMGLPSFNLCPTLLLFYSLISFLSQTRTEAVATYLNHSCSSTTTFTANITFQSNLKQLLTYLSSNATSNIESYNATASTGNSVDTVYGLYVCRGDLPADTCQSCVAGATEDIVERCPTNKVVVAWYDECTLRYSSQYFFSNMVTDPNVSMVNNLNVSEQTRFNQLVRTTMNDLASGIANVRTGAKKFGTKEANFTVLQTLYTLAQCTPDLSGFDCNRCLQIAIQTLPNCCGGKQGGRVLYPSCIARFELYKFYQGNATSALVPSPPSPGSETTSKGKLQLLSCCSFQMIGKLGILVRLFSLFYYYYYYLLIYLLKRELGIIAFTVFTPGTLTSTKF